MTEGRAEELATEVLRQDAALCGQGAEEGPGFEQRDVGVGGGHREDLSARQYMDLW